MVGGLGVTELLDRSVERDARGQLDEGLSRVRRYGAGGEVMGSDLAVYIQAFETRPRMVIFGAIDFSAEMAKLAGEVGYEVTICDAREPFVDSPRFSQVAEVVVDWPDRYLEGRELGPRDVVLVFTHDAKFDEPALISTLATGAGYVGALGSRRTQETAGRAAARGRARRRGDRQDPRAVRARRRGAHAGGDGRLDPRRGDRGARRAPGREPARHERPDPSRDDGDGRRVADA